MLGAIVKRLGQMLFVMFGISVLVFLIFFATPGADPAARIAGRNASPEILRPCAGLRLRPAAAGAVRAHDEAALHHPGPDSFVNRGWKVVPAVLDVVPVTLSLVIGAAILWMAGGIVIGLIAAATKNSLLDRSLMMLGLIGVSMPVFWLGAVMNLLTQSMFHDTWLFGWVPPLGYKPLLTDPAGWFLTLVVPWVTLATSTSGSMAACCQSGGSRSGRHPHRAPRAGETRILVRHACVPRSSPSSPCSGWISAPGRRRGAADRSGVRAAGHRQADL
jgi:peptide/nickel transport system permease protein